MSKREPQGAPGNDDGEIWVCIATHGMSEDEVIAALDAQNDRKLAEKVAGWRDQGIGAADITELRQSWLAYARKQARYDAPNIIRDMAATSGAMVH